MARRIGSLELRDEFGGAGTRVVLLVSGLLASFLIWACLAEIEEVTRGDGRVIPSQKTQIVQSAEPGVVKELLVRLGQRVAKGDLLMRIDKSTTAASLGEVEAQSRALTAQIARLELEHEAEGRAPYICPAELRPTWNALCDNEQKLYAARVSNLVSRVKVFKERSEQKSRELNEVAANVERLKESLALADRELKMIKPLADRKIIADTELIRVQRGLSDARGQLNAALETKGRTEAALREANLQVEEQVLDYKQTAQKELNEKRAQLSIVQQTMQGAAERVRRTDIHSPVDGFVNEVLVTTLGAFVNAGERVVSIVPAEDQLLVEARVRPADIAFIHNGQPAVVKVTAFDFSIFGGLDGLVENVSADTLIDPTTKEPFYTVIVRTKDSTLQGRAGNLEIIPGMVCNVDIMTGKKTIMQYLLKPIQKARETAFRER